jgi:hypothetical protein
MSAWWDHPAGWRDAMLPPPTFAEALKAARRAKAASFAWRGVTFNLAEPETAAVATLTPLEAWRAKKNARRS